MENLQRMVFCIMYLDVFGKRSCGKRMGWERDLRGVEGCGSEKRMPTVTLQRFFCKFVSEDYRNKFCLLKRGRNAGRDDENIEKINFVLFPNHLPFCKKKYFPK